MDRQTVISIPLTFYHFRYIPCITFMTSFSELIGRREEPDHFGKIVDRSKEKAYPSIGIYNETDPLREAVIWGPIGAEAILAQIYPEDISLFYADMDVSVARMEADSFQNTLESHNVKIKSARNLLAELIPTPQEPLDKETIISDIISRSRIIRSEFNTPATNQIKQEHQIRELIEDDIKRYGEQKALALNKILCLDVTYPLGNSLFARDQMNVLLGTRFISRMSKPIRKAEVALYELVYEALLKDVHSVQIPEGETFEGGDAYIHNGTVYVGVGVRTTKGAAEFIYKTLKPELDSIGLKFAIVEDEHPESRSARDAMDFMHLDTFSGPIGDREISVCKEEAQLRRVKFLECDTGGNIITIDTGNNFLEHLQKQEDLVIIIPREEQKLFGCNFLALDEYTILLPLDSNEETNQQLRQAGKNLIFLGLNESTNGYGASHCMTGQLVRSH